VLEPSWVQWSLKPSSTLKPHKPDSLVWETSLSGFEVIMSWSLPLSWCLSLLLEPCSALLWPPLDFPLHQTLLCHWLKIYSPALSSLDCLLAEQQEAHWVPSAPAGDHMLSLPPAKLDGLVWHSGLSDFPALKLLCPADGRCVRSSHLLHSSLYCQNPKQVLTIPGGSASIVAPMDRTTPCKEDKVGTSSVEALMS
jgi:hypothetical protein